MRLIEPKPVDRREPEPLSLYLDIDVGDEPLERPPVPRDEQVAAEDSQTESADDKRKQTKGSRGPKGKNHHKERRDQTRQESQPESTDEPKAE